jgi:hypothetical protein
LIVITDLSLSLRLGLMIDQAGEGIIAKHQIGGGRNCDKRTVTNSADVMLRIRGRQLGTS